MTDFDDEPELHQRPNKSQLKRESAALEDLGETLIDLPAERLNRFELAPDLYEAVRLAQSITSHSARKRQRKFIAKLLREMDVEHIRAKLAELTQQSAEAIHQQHQTERWRDRMLAEADPAINAFLELHPLADRQKLRQLIRDAQRERQLEAPPRSARLLFKYLREFLTGATEPDEFNDTLD